jgi:hypothetical protein
VAVGHDVRREREAGRTSETLVGVRAQGMGRRMGWWSLEILSQGVRPSTRFQMQLAHTDTLVSTQEINGGFVARHAVWVFVSGV